jgi:hypothetical protein
VRGRDQHAVRLDFRPLGRQLPGVIQKLPRHHAAIDDDDRDALAAVIDHDRAGMQLGSRLLRAATEHVAVDQHRKLQRRDVDCGCAGFQLGQGLLGSRAENDEEQGGLGEAVHRSLSEHWGRTSDRNAQRRPTAVVQGLC